jgi:plasmid stabilization system protein ParE
MSDIRFLEPARRELLNAVDYYEAQSPGLGRALTNEIEDSLARLESNPSLGATHIEGTRRILLDRFPFSLIYLNKQEAIIVVAVAHLRRKPGYWKER